ncbi:sohB [Symbiodinium natans]|uniref:SohB protein n=1 Tax=Symbiodinium natans TaxID=878477 RepID=A0A812PKY2_9DINO|nr:sohB [Symbiodinium natans]
MASSSEAPKPEEPGAEEPKASEEPKAEESTEEPKAEEPTPDPAPKAGRTFSQRELYQAGRRINDNTGKVKQGLGATLALGGTGILVWHHWAAFASFNCLGAGLLALGAAIARTGTSRGEKAGEAHFKLRLLNNSDRWKADAKALDTLLGTDTFQQKDLAKAAAEAEKKEQQLLKEAVKKQSEDVKEALKAGEGAAEIQARLRPRTFVFDFSTSSLDAGVPGGKSMKKRLQDFRDTISFILHCATEHDEAVVRITSPGGAVIDYGYASSQLMRLRQRGLKLTACVDMVAASGGYMMACTADTIVATPFSLVGSIGVLASLPNFNKVLRRYEVDWLQFTGGRYKRTVDPMSEPTEEGIEKMKQEINTVHDAFKGMVLKQRTHLDMDEVATGEAFLGSEGKERGLVDRLATSDEVLEERMEVSDVIEVSLTEKKRGLRELLEGKIEAAENLVVDCWERATGLGRRGAVELKDPQF